MSLLQNPGKLNKTKGLHVLRNLMKTMAYVSFSRGADVIPAWFRTKATLFCRVGAARFFAIAPTLAFRMSHGGRKNRTHPTPDVTLSPYEWDQAVIPTLERA